MLNVISKTKQDNGIYMSNLGFFGKIPLTGDFIHRRMSSVFMNRWDEWLKVNILHSQNQLGEQWLPLYSQSPMWRFCIAPGVIDDKAYLGIMIPSVDSVGRYFPLTVAQAVEPKAIAFMLSDTANQWFQNIEDLLLDLLEGYESKLQDFDAKIAALQPKWIDTISDIPSGLSSLDKSFNLRVEVSSANSINHSVSSLMLNNLVDNKKAFTFWWNEGSEAYSPSILLSDKLPATDQFSALLDGSWDEHKWVSIPLASPALQKGLFTEKKSEQTIVDLIKEDLDVDLEDITISPLVNPTSTYHCPQAFKPIPESFGFTDPGNSRKENEDALLLKPSAGLWLVADGMGGHSFGSYASQLVVNRIAATDVSGTLEQALNKIHIALQDVNTHLVDYAQQHEQSVCGSTVIGMIMNKQNCIFFWAGDSRLYLVRNQKIIQLSKDHSVEQEQIDQGLIEKDDPNFSGKNLITRAVGGDRHLELEICYHQPQPGDQFFLCSDGVYNEISDQEIENIINMPNSAKERCLTMNEEIISRAARDNFTGIIVEV